MKYVIVERDMVQVESVDINIFPFAIEAPDDIIYGDLYINGEFKKVAPRPEPIVYTQEELRKQAYLTLTEKENKSPLILWHGENITVDNANKIYLEYFAENNDKAIEIQKLIISAKLYIRELYPDIIK